MKYVTTPAEGIERMRMLYAMLAGIPKSVLDLRYWRESSDEKMADEHPEVTCPTDDKGLMIAGQSAMKDSHYCGTTACAIGWATAYPPFVELGFGFSHRYSISFVHEEGPNTAILGKFSGERMFNNWTAVQQFFYLSEEEVAMFTGETSTPDVSMFSNPRETRINTTPANTYLFDDPGPKQDSDKRKILARVRNYLHSKGAITLERVNELRAMEESDTFIWETTGAV